MPSVFADQIPTPHPDQIGSGIRLLLWDIRSPINFGMLLRVAETYRAPIAAFGTEHSLSATARDFACGALERVGYTEIENVAGLRTWQGKSRLVATSIERGSESLPDFHFVPGDVIALGNEYDGLPAELESRADCKLRIPMADVWTPKPRSSSPIDPNRTAPVAREGSPNLNVAMAGAIICYAAYTQALQRWVASHGIVA
jgi:tRNA G18 (ribose-2'-O)-methylase SpoU